MRIAILCSRVRVEERLLFAAFEKLGIEAIRLDEREIAARIGEFTPEVDIVLERSVSTSAGLVALQLFEAAGVPTVNTYRTATICSDKLATSLALARHNVPQPVTEIAMSTSAALEAWPRATAEPSIVRSTHNRSRDKSRMVTSGGRQERFAASVLV